MTTRTWSSIGQSPVNATVELDGSLYTAGNPDVLGKIDIDLRADAVASGKVNTLVFFLPSDDPNMFYAATIKLPASGVIMMVQDVLQKLVGSMYPDAKVPQDGKFDCKTAAYMVVAHQMLAQQGVGDVAGWPLDAFDLRGLLDNSSWVNDMLGDVVQGYNQENGVNLAFTKFATVLPEDTKAIKFHRAEVPTECMPMAKQGTRWGLVAAVGILVAGAVGATYAISQYRKAPKHPHDAK